MRFHDICKYFHIINCRKSLLVRHERLAENMWCKQYRENNDAEKLCSLGVNDKDPSNIMAYIYGSQNRILL